MSTTKLAPDTAGAAPNSDGPKARDKTQPQISGDMQFANTEVAINSNNYQGTSQVSSAVNTAPEMTSAEAAAVVDKADDVSSCESASSSSTRDLGYESFDTFKDKVRTLILQLFPKTIPEAITLEKMSGGGNNRVVGVNIVNPVASVSGDSIKALNESFSALLNTSQTDSPSTTKAYILRIPFDDEHFQLEHKLATLEFVAQHTPYPTPRVVLLDKSANNAIGNPYMLLHRLPGQSLAALWDTLNLNQKESVMRIMVQIQMELHRITSPVAGIITRDETMGAPGHFEGFSINQVGLGEWGIMSEAGPTARPQSTLELLLDMCDRWIEDSAESTVDASGSKIVAPCPLMFPIYRRYARAANKLHDLGYLPDDEVFHFEHGSLAPRNIVGVVQDDRTVKITGILDWDRACFVPKFMSLQPPYWMWNETIIMYDHETGTETISEPLALTTPPTPEDVAMKRVYEGMVSSEILKYAYTPEYIFARQLYRALTEGVSSTHKWKGVKKMLKEFGQLHGMKNMSGCGVEESDDELDTD